MLFEDISASLEGCCCGCLLVGLERPRNLAMQRFILEGMVDGGWCWEVERGFLLGIDGKQAA
jgi:hypothetical protein